MAGGGVEEGKVRMGGGIAMDFPVNDCTAPSAEALSLSSSPLRVPRRIRKRLLDLEEAAKRPCTVEEIETKLKLADLRRQQFYEELSRKARPKPRSPSRSSSQDEDLGQRLEAKLQAAEKKRLSILESAQLRLARLDELRQAAKAGVEMRSARERERLGTKVESRVKQAELNRMLILKAYKQRRATLRERSSQSLMRRISRESKYKERVRAAIHQKRAAAEKKRLGLLEAEKKRACARVLQVRRVAKSVSHQREVERRQMRDQLEHRLQRAKRQRAEYLRQRARRHNSVQVNWNRMYKQADLLSRKLARCWRRFYKLKRTTVDLAKDYVNLNINQHHIKSTPFEQLAHQIESTTTLQTLKSLLDRLENRFTASGIAGSTSRLDNIDHLLKRVATPKKRTTPRSSTRTRETKKVGAPRESARSPVKLSRYPVRVVLCAYMILSHPDAVFSSQGEREIALAKSADNFIREFELLIKIILDGPTQSSDEESESLVPKHCTFRSQLACFDKAWCSYLNCFVVWKVKDAKSLEEDLVRAACQLELSMIQKCKLTPSGDSNALTHDMKAIQKQVMEDQKLLREKVRHLSGEAGIERMESALSEARSKYFEEKENGSPVGSPVTHLLASLSTPSSLAGPSVARSPSVGRSGAGESPNRVVRSLFREDDSSQRDFGSSAAMNNNLVSQLGSAAEKLITENELIINEFLHEHRHNFVDRALVDEDGSSIKARVKETMEKAFWDGILESLKQEKPNYEPVVQLVTEVRDEISKIAPESWKEEILEVIDVDLLTEVLKSGNLDIDYLAKILQFALVTLQKLSSPAEEDEMKIMHQKLLNELAETCQTRDESNCSHAIAMIKGLRFVLEQIQALKREISKARIAMLEPLLKGPAGLEYLRKAFTNHHGSHSDGCTSLPVTMNWLLSVKNCKDQEWEEHINCLSALMSEETSQVFLPSTVLRTGGSYQVKTDGRGMPSPAKSTVAGGKQPEPECSGEKIDLMIRLGLLKLVTGVSGLTQQTLPETFMLNLSRLRAVQAQIQKIMVILTSMLVCRQTLVMERAVSSITEMESILSNCTSQLLEVLDRVDNIGMEEIVEIISGFSQGSDKAVDSDKLQSKKLVMARMLAKSLQAGNPVFEKVSRAVYVAMRGVVLGGSGPQGRKLAEAGLRQVGGAMLTERVVDTAEVLIVAATVSVGVHRPWYVSLTNDM